jgi:hypothetical protein
MIQKNFVVTNKETKINRGFFPTNIKPSLMFVSEAVEYLSRAPLSKVGAWPYIRPSSKDLRGTNTLTYLAFPPVLSKNFIAMTPGPNVITLFVCNLQLFVIS